MSSAPLEAAVEARPDELARPSMRLCTTLALVLVWPLLLLLPCLCGARVFLPYDLAQYPPSSFQRTAAELAAMRAESNYDVTETPIWFVPELQRASRTIFAEGSLPNWNPTARTGTALLPHGHDAIWYPFTWPALLLDDPSRWLAWLAFLNLAAAGIGMLGFLRAQRLHPAAAVLGAIAFSLSTTLLANAHNFPRLSSLVWLPSMLWALRAAADSEGRTRTRALCGFAVAFALTFLGGFPPYALPCAVLAMVYGLTLSSRELAMRGGGGIRRSVTVALASLLGVLLCAHYLLPAFAFFGESARSLTPDLDRISQTKFDRYGLLGWLLPDLFSRPDLSTTLPYGKAPLPLLLGNRTSTNGTVLQPNFNATEYALFSGTIVVWLAVLGAFARTATHRFLPVLMLAGCLSMAMFLPGFDQLFLLPGLRVVPPLRWLGPCCCLVAWLAAQGLHAALSSHANLRLRITAGLAFATAALALWFSIQFGDPEIFRHWNIAEQLARHYGPSAPDPSSITPLRIEELVLRGPGGIDYTHNGAALAATATSRAAAFHAISGLALLLLSFVGRGARNARYWPLLTALVLALTGVDLWLAGRTFDRGIARPHSDRTEVHDFLARQRTATAASGGFMIARAAPTVHAAELPEPIQLPPGTLASDDIRDLQVYTYYDSRSMQPWTRLLGLVLGGDAGLGVTGKGYLTSCLPDHAALMAHPLLDLCGIRYILSTAPLQHAGVRTGPPWKGEHGEFFVYERATALPRAFVVGSLAVHESDDDVLTAMVDPLFAPKRVAFAVKNDLGGLDPSGLAQEAAQREVRFVKDHATTVELAVGDGPTGLLVLTDTYFTGFTATVDGEDAEVVRVDHSMRGVLVPAGARTVRFHYTPSRQQLGLALFGCGLLGLLLVWQRTRNSSPA